MPEVVRAYVGSECPMETRVMLNGGGVPPGYTHCTAIELMPSMAITKSVSLKKFNLQYTPNLRTRSILTFKQRLNHSRIKEGKM